MQETGRSENKGLSLRKNFSWSMFANVVYAACQWGILTILAKYGSAADVGEYSLGLAITAPVFLFSQMHLRTLQVTDRTDEYQFSSYLSIRLITSLIAMMVVVFFVVGASYSTGVSLVIISVGLYKAVESVFDIYHGKFQRSERMDLVAWSILSKGPITLGVMAIVFFLTESLFWSVIASAAGCLLSLYFFDIPRSERIHSGKKSSDREKFGLAARRIVPKALPLGVVAALVSLVPNIPRFFIEAYLGISSLGIFSALAYVLVVGRLVVTAAAQSSIPRLSQYYSSGDVVKFNKLLRRLVGVACVIGALGIAGAMLFGRQALAILFTLEYSRYHMVFVLIMVSAWLSYVATFLWQGLMAANLHKLQVPMFMAVCLICLSSSAILIPSSGLEGAAIALIVAMASQCLLSWAMLYWGTNAVKSHPKISNEATA